MLSPGQKALCQFSISAPGRYESEWVADLDGMESLAVQMNFTGGAGGVSVKAYLQTSFDQEQSAIDIACFTFATVAARKVRNLTNAPATADVTPSDAALADDQSVNGLLGDRLRVVIVVDGTYTGAPYLYGSGVAR